MSAALHPARPHSLEVSLRAGGRSLTVRVHDVTPEGCAFDRPAGPLKPDDRVILRFPGNIAVIGRITLLRGEHGRVRFDPPMHPAVVAHFVA